MSTKNITAKTKKLLLTLQQEADLSSLKKLLGELVNILEQQPPQSLETWKIDDKECYYLRRERLGVIFKSRLGVTAVVASAPPSFFEKLLSSMFAFSVVWLGREGGCEGVTALFDRIPIPLFEKLYDLFAEATCEGLGLGVRESDKKEGAMCRAG